MRYSLILVLSFFLSGCPLDGDDGSVGTTGQQGLVGLSCWDLNENGMKDSSEDTNKDGAIDVWDCRTTVGVVGNHRDAPNENEFSPTDLDRQMYVSNGYISDPQHRLTMYSGTQGDAFNPDDNFQEALLVDPIGDPCGLWKWKPALDIVNQEISGLYVLQPENAVAYQTEPLIVVSTDAAGNPMYGWQACVNECLDSSICVGVAYASNENTWNHTVGGSPNSMTCTLLRDVGREIGSDVEFSFFETANRGALSAALTYDSSFLQQGIASVCAAP